MSYNIQMSRSFRLFLVYEFFVLNLCFICDVNIVFVCVLTGDPDSLFDRLAKLRDDVIVGVLAGDPVSPFDRLAKLRDDVIVGVLAGDPVSPFDRLAEELEDADSEVTAGLYEGDIAGAPHQVSDPGYMSGKIRKFRTDKLDTWNKLKFWHMYLM